ncbi:unnamed protein product [Aureobasidium vineae]|uniref:Uncharacterized protein n=1 Tax=Aureobasidium vineae TaxID=2773715 RepID=A0A9N8PH25_9PEZI|nr:unnamed protein product [Aureobasidium vineae]
MSASNFHERSQMARNSPDYVPSETSVRNSPLPGPGPAMRSSRPALPRNAVMSREHPPLYAGDYNNNLSKDMYWWEKLDVDDPEEKRVLLAMYYGEERQPRCNVCEKQNRACMWFLGEEDQINKSCVKCRRVHATCKTIGSIEPNDDLRPSIETRENTAQQRISSHKHKATEPDVTTSVKRTRSSLRVYSTRESTDDQPEVICVRSQDKQEADKLELHHQSGFERPLYDETQFNTLPDQSSTADRRGGRLSSVTLGADVRYSQDTPRSLLRVPPQQSQDNTLPGFSQIEKGLCAIIDERYKNELDGLRAMIKNQAADHQAQLMALRADLTRRDHNGEAVDEHQIKELETQIETERVNRRRLEDENTRLKSRMTRLESGQKAGLNDLQEQIRKLREGFGARY